MNEPQVFGVFCRPLVDVAELLGFRVHYIFDEFFAQVVLQRVYDFPDEDGEVSFVEVCNETLNDRSTPKELETSCREVLAALLEWTRVSTIQADTRKLGEYERLVKRNKELYSEVQRLTDIKDDALKRLDNMHRLFEKTAENGGKG